VKKEKNVVNKDGEIVEIVRAVLWSCLMAFEKLIVQGKSCALPGREMPETYGFLWLYHRLISYAPPVQSVL
jgi:hypothetical protein